MTLDSIIVISSVFISFWIIHSHAFLAAYLPNVLIITSIFLLVFHHFFAMIFHLYNKVWAYASVVELLTIVKSVTCTVFAAGIVQLIINDFVIYKRMLLVTWMVYIILIGASRFAWRRSEERRVGKECSARDGG